MRMLWLVLVAGCEVKCGAETKWTSSRSHQAYSQGFVVDIPQGWRDTNDLVDRPTVPPDSTVLLPESLGDGEILLGRSDVLKSSDDCVRWQDAVDRHGKVTLWGAQPVTFDGDLGCVMNIKRDDNYGHTYLRSHGDRAVLVRCLGSIKDLDRACDQVVHGLKPPAT